MASVPASSPIQRSTAPASRPRLIHIPELDGMRGVAALMVLCHHLFFTSIPHPEQWGRFVVLMAALSHAGGYGVDLFFVLSGFLITSLLLLDRNSPHYYWNFYWKRVLRILPLYLVALACLVALLPASWRYALLSLVFLANFAQLFHVASAGPFWTLAIEEQFYLVWPSFARRLRTEALERFALALVVACPLLRLADVAIHHYNYQFTFFHCDGLALGAVLACQQLRLHSSPRPAQQLSLVLIAVLLIALPFAFGFESTAGRIFGALQLTGISLLCYCLIAWAVRHSGAAELALFRSRTLTFFGLLSYCLYICNSYVVDLYDHLRGPMATGNMTQYAIRAAAVFSATVALSIVSRYAIELPAMSLRRPVLRADLPGGLRIGA